MRLWPTVLALLLLQGATAQAQSPAVPTSLFVHLIDVQDAPINTQEPPADYSADAGWGGTTTTVRCLHPLTGDVGGTGLGTAGTTAQAFHTWRGYGVPNVIRYDVRAADGSPRMNPSRGVWGNISVDATAPMALHWFLKASMGGSPPGAVTPELQSPVIMVPDVAVHATIRSGHAISVDDTSYDGGRLLFTGAAGPATLANGEVVPGDGATGMVRAAGQVDGAWVYEFVMPLQAIDPVILVSEGYNLRVDVLMDNPACEDPEATFMPGLVAQHSSPGLRPRIDWSVHDPMAVGHLGLAFDEEGRSWTSVEAATVFGPVDVKDLEVRLTRIARDGTTQSIPMTAKRSEGDGPCGHDCGHTTEMLYAPQADLAAGKYNLTVSYSNLQGTAHRTMSDEITIEPSVQSPGIASLPLLALLAGLAILARRR